MNYLRIKSRFICTTEIGVTESFFMIATLPHIRFHENAMKSSSIISQFCDALDNSENDAETNMDSSCSSSSENDTDEFDSDIGEGTNIICSNSKYYQTKVV